MAIHDERGYEDVRAGLADQYESHAHQPQLEIVKMEPKTRTLYINYKPYRGRALKNVTVMLKHLQNLWGNNPVVIKDDKGNTLS